MSRLFGPLRQMGYVVPDVEAAMHHWIHVCGIGPWFYAERLPLTSFSYMGRRHDDIHLSIALANSGDVQIELIQQRSDHPSLGREFLAALANGYQVAQEGDAPRGRFVYFRNEGHPGTIIEMSHATPTRKHIFDAVREAAVGWDGSDPIRTGWPA